MQRIGVPRIDQPIAILMHKGKNPQCLQREIARKRRVLFDPHDLGGRMRRRVRCDNNRKDSEKQNEKNSANDFEMHGTLDQLLQERCLDREAQ